MFNLPLLFPNIFLYFLVYVFQEATSLTLTPLPQIAII